jgi:carbonic anhydrase
LNRAALNKVLDEVPGGGHVLLDAQNTDYIDPDVLDLIRDFAERGGPARDVEVSMRGFRTKYQLRDQIQFVDYSTQELQSALTPSQVLDILKEGHRRFRTGRRLTRDLGRLVNVTAQGQHPLAVVLSCIDSRTPAELIFDLGVGDIFSVRIAGNVISPNVLGSIEFACVVAGAKLIVVMGHTRCGAVTAAVDRCSSFENAPPKNTCENLDHIIREIQKVVDVSQCQQNRSFDQAQKETFLNGISRRNITRSVETILHQSSSIERLVREGQVAIVGAIYDVVTGDIDFLSRNSEKMAQCGDSQAILEATNACLVKGAGGERKTPFSNGLKGDV